MEWLSLLFIFIGAVYLPLIGVLDVVYYKLIKPHYKRVHEKRRQRANEGPSYGSNNRIKPPEMPEGVIADIVRKNHIPSYWAYKPNCKEGLITKQNITNDAEYIKILVYTMWSPKDVGIGKDAADVGEYKFIKITKVQRVENIPLWIKYDQARQSLVGKEEVVKCFRELKQEVRTTQTIDQIPELANSPLGRDVDHDINEHYLFHGTRPMNVKSIVKAGLSTQFASNKSMFGKGVYTAENPSKSDQYTDTRKDVMHKNKKMFLCRVCLGELFISGRPANDLQEPPCRDCYQYRCDEHYFTFDSAVGDVPGLRFREFIVYRDYRVYPEYIITYDRVIDDNDMRKYRKN